MKGQAVTVEQIIAALPFDFVRKMRNWARSNLDSGQYARSRIFEDIAAGDAYGSHMPIMAGEADDVDKCLMAVPNRYRQAVMLFWQYEGRPLRWLGRRLQVSHITAETRVQQGHELLQRALNQRSARIAEYVKHAQCVGAAR